MSSKSGRVSRPQTETSNYGKVDTTKPASVGTPGNSAPGAHKRGRQG